MNRQMWNNGRHIETDIDFLFFNNAFENNLTNIDHAHHVKSIQIEYAGIEPTHKYEMRFITFEFENNLFNYGNSFPTYKSLKPIDFYKSYNIFFETNNFRRISLENGVLCEDRRKGLFNDYIFDYLINDCIHKLINDSLKCLPFHVPLFLEPKQGHFVSKYNHCNHFKPDYILFHKVLRKCKTQYKPDCDIQSINIHNTVQDSDEWVTPYTTPTQINIIPVNSKMIQYTEKYRYSLNDWFYQIGGTIGVWFGWSVLSLPDFMIVTKHKISKFYYKIISNEYLFT